MMLNLKSLTGDTDLLIVNVTKGVEIGSSEDESQRLFRRNDARCTICLIFRDLPMQKKFHWEFQQLLFQHHIDKEAAELIQDSIWQRKLSGFIPIQMSLGVELGGALKNIIALRRWYQLMV